MMASEEPGPDFPTQQLAQWETPLAQPKFRDVCVHVWRPLPLLPSHWNHNQNTDKRDHSALRKGVRIRVLPCCHL